MISTWPLLPAAAEAAADSADLAAAAEWAAPVAADSAELNQRSEPKEKKKEDILWQRQDSVERYY
jgi:hypothetical protein